MDIWQESVRWAGSYSMPSPALQLPVIFYVTSLHVGPRESASSTSEGSAVFHVGGKTEEWDRPSKWTEEKNKRKACWKT